MVQARSRNEPRVFQKGGKMMDGTCIIEANEVEIDVCECKRAHKFYIGKPTGMRM